MYILKSIKTHNNFYAYVLITAVRINFRHFRVLTTYKNTIIYSKEETKCPVNVNNIYYLTQCNTQKYKVNTTNCGIKIKTDF
jgi:hypothetical protein